MAERKPKGKPKRAKAKPKSELAETEALGSLDDTERVGRNLQIWRLWLDGTDVPTLAETYGLAQGTVQNILTTMRSDAQRLSSMKGIDVVEEWVLKNRAGIGQLARVAAAEKGATKVTAINSRLAREDKLLEVLQSVGLLPHDLGNLRVELDGIELANRMLDVLDRQGVLTPELMDAIAEEFPSDAIEGSAREVEVA